MNLRNLFVLVSALAFLPMAYTHAEPVRVKQLVIDSVFARATVPGQPVGVVYFTVRNSGTSPDRLLSASSPIASHVTLHSTVMMQGMSSMHHLEAFDIPAGGVLELRPGGFHLMLDDLKAPLKQGGLIALKLNFEKSGEVDVSVPVRGPGAGMDMAPMHHDMR